MDQWHAKFVTLDTATLQSIAESSSEKPVTREELKTLASRSIDIIHQINELQDAVIACNLASAALRTHLELQ